MRHDDNEEIGKIFLCCTFRIYKYIFKRDYGIMSNQILPYIYNTYFARYFSGHTRTVKAKKNILAMLILKGVSIVIGFLMVPITLRYLNPTNYGIWLTISSIIGWFSFFDIGLGNGLRNKYAEAIANDDVTLARTYVSTTYAFLSIIIGIVFAFFLCINPFLDWSKILNTPAEMSADLSLIVFVTVGFFCLRFIFGLVGTILVADQKPAFNSFLEVLSNLLSLLLILILVLTSRSSLFRLSAAIGFSTAIVPIVASVWMYARKYKHIRPSPKFVKKKYARDLMQLGLKFFLLQIGGVIAFSTSNIIITQLFTPADVVPYNIAFKYFNMLSMLYSIILTPFWSAYTEAYTRHDLDWIRRTMVVLKRAWFVLVAAVILLSIFADTFYRFWVGGAVRIPFAISATMGLYVLILGWCSVYVSFINGTGKIQLQIIGAVAISILNIPLAIFLSTYCHLGITGVILAPCLCLLPQCVLWPIQVRKILSGTAKGIWDR
jgi:O-antigen/teichoic acid export membrane protein